MLRARRARAISAVVAYQKRREAFRQTQCQIDLKIRLRDSRKEVIQPQVLLQLPCYDFTPITDHTLGACLPCGLARRLLVQPAFVM